MKVGDLVVNNNPSSGFHEKLAIIESIIGNEEKIEMMLINVLFNGRRVLWIAEDCEVINESR